MLRFRPISFLVFPIFIFFYSCNKGATPAGPENVSYSADIQPIFDDSCIFSGCHGGSEAGGLNLTSYEELMEGDSENGPVVIPYESENSILVKKLIDPPFGDRMPMGRPPLNRDKIKLIEMWIDEGAMKN